jgi:hypothetical protein
MRGDAASRVLHPRPRTPGKTEGVAWRAGAATYTAPHVKPRLVIAVLLPLLLAGCVRRSLTVKSDPPGTIVYLNGVEVGRTPMTRDFTWYGTYDVVLRKEGYETLKTEGQVIAPWWQWVPIDLFAELLPLRDRRELAYTMKPYAAATVDPQQALSRAEGMEKQLRSSRYTRKPATTPTTAPTR